jgi:hypothetical protein
MRGPTDNCLLCGDKNASKKSSHIIPKFFGQGLFFGTKPKHSLLLTKDGKREKVQDIMKEDHLFCPDCEKGFSILETYCSLRLDRYNELRYSSQYQHFKHSDFEFFECKKIDLRVFNLFIYSIVWRVSICNNYGFLGFKLSSIEEEKLRFILKEFTSLTQEELFVKIDKIGSLPEHSHVIIRPDKKLRPPTSMLSAASYNEFIHQIHLVDYVLIYFTNRAIITERFKEMDNNRLVGFVRIGVTNKTKWEDFNRNMFKEAIKK